MNTPFRIPLTEDDELFLQDMQKVQRGAMEMMGAQERRRIRGATNTAAAETYFMMKNLAERRPFLMSFSREEWERGGIIVSDEARNAIENIVWHSEELLSEPCPFFSFDENGNRLRKRDTHIHFFGIKGMTIQGLKFYFPGCFNQAVDWDCSPWEFGRETLTPTYEERPFEVWSYFMLKSVPPWSPFHTRQEQLDMIPRHYMPTTPVQEVMKHIALLRLIPPEKTLQRHEDFRNFYVNTAGTFGETTYVDRDGVHYGESIIRVGVFDNGIELRPCPLRMVDARTGIGLCHQLELGVIAGHFLQ